MRKIVAVAFAVSALAAAPAFAGGEGGCNWSKQSVKGPTSTDTVQLPQTPKPDKPAG